MAIASLLLTHGAEVNARGQLEWTPLINALTAQKEMVTLLLEHKADPNVRFRASLPVTPGFGQVERSGKDYTPLLLTALDEKPEVIELLLAAKADPNLQSEDGSTPIINALPVGHWPASEKRRRVVRLLLEHGADINARNSQGATPLMLALLGKDKEMFELLLSHKPDLNAKSKTGSAALHFAAEMSFEHDVYDLTELLLKAGADVNVRDNIGATPLRVTSYRKETKTSQAVAALLRKYGAVEELPDFDRIEARPAHASFAKGTNDWNRFTVMELLAVTYHLLSANPAGEPRESKPSNFILNMGYASDAGLTFPDLSRLTIRHPGQDLKDWRIQVFDLASVLKSGDCDNDLPLDWGDIVEIPQADHLLNEGWQGFSQTELLTFAKCLSREVQIIVKGKPTKIALAPEITPEAPYAKIVTKASFWIRPVLRNSKLLLASSDVSRVKVTRRDAESGQRYEWVLDCSDSKPAPDLWLRNGDLIEVPDVH